MAMGFGASGMMAGAASGINNATDMIFQNYMQDKRHQNAQDLQQNNPYLRLAANRLMGGAGGAGVGTGSTGSASDMVSQKINPGYGRDGGPGGKSDPSGAFNPMKMSSKDMYGDPGYGIMKRAEHTQTWQNDSLPAVKDYIKTKQAYDTTMEKKVAMDQKMQDSRMTKESAIKQLGTQYEETKDPAIFDQVRQLTLKLEQDEQEYQAFMRQVQELEGNLGLAGDTIMRLMDGEYTDTRKTLPGYDDPDDKENPVEPPSANPNYGKSAMGMLSRGGPKDPSLHIGGRTPGATGPELLTPNILGEKVFPPRQVPNEFSASNYSQNPSASPRR